jgi:two-component system, sensor histidine kinase and response regulator
MIAKPTSRIIAVGRRLKAMKLSMACVTITLAHIPYALHWQPTGHFFTLPLLVIALSMALIAKRNVDWLLGFSFLIFTITALATRSGAWEILADIGFEGVALLTLKASDVIRRLSYQRQAKAWRRLTNRLKRQSELLRTSDSQLVTAIKTQQDAQNAYLQSESERQTLLEHLPVYVLQKDTQGRFTFATQSFCRLLDRQLSDVIGKTDADLFPPETAEKFRRDDHEVMELGEVFNDIERTQLPDGRRSYMQVRKAPLKNAAGETCGVQVIFWDVTEEFTSRIELQRIESLAHALINAALDAVLIVDTGGQVLEANPACERILGYTPDQLESHPPLGEIMQAAVLDAAAPHEVAEFVGVENASSLGDRGPLNRLLKDATGRRIEVRLRRRNNSWFDAEISAHPLTIENSSGWAIFIRDITRRKSTEKELRTAKENAEQASIAKSEFVANVSHELRTPLTGIIGLHELLQDSDLDDQQREYMDLARLSAGNLLTLIDDLLDFSKIESHQLELDVAPFSLIECVEKSVISVAARAQLRGLELLIDLAPDLPNFVIGDSHRLQQILLNLVGNAIKFTERGEIRVRVEWAANEHPPESTPENPPARKLRFEVHDSGIGMDAHQLDIIFDPFRQADNSTTRRYGGTGLGLAICRELVTLMRGTINVTSQSGHGSLFFFEIPLVPTSASSEEKELKTLPTEVHDDLLANDQERDITVVLATNECLQRSILRREIELAGYQVVEMSVNQLIAREPVELFVAGNHTIVVTDYRELASRELKHPPVVVKWVLLIPLSHARPRALPNWLTYAETDWLAMPWRRADLRESMHCHTPQSTTVQVAATLAQQLTTPVRSGNILLVEDSPISQTVLSDMLRKLGHHVEVVGSGKDAVSRCRTQGYDLVLMDIQMPGIDGHEATQQIRSAEQESGHHQIIVALTAHAMPSDRVRCQEVGMDGFLVKPIAFDALKQAVDAVLDPRRKAESFLFCEHLKNDTDVHAQRVVESPGGTPEATSAVDIQGTSAGNGPVNDGIERNIASLLDDAPDWPQLLQLFDNNSGLLAEVLSLLGREAPRLQRLYNSSLELGNCAEARRAVHTLKSNSRYVGLSKVAEAAERLEQLARDGNLQKLKSNSAALSEMIDRVVNWTELMLHNK